MTYEQWMKLVDRRLARCFGVWSDMLPDWGSYDAWKDGMTPKDAAEEWIEWAKTF